MPKYPVLLCEDEQLGPIHRACQLHQPLGVNCGRGALKENGPFVKERLRIGLTGWGQRLLRADSTLVYVIQACLLRYNRRGQDSRRAHPDSLRDAQGPRVALRGGVIGTNHRACQLHQPLGVKGGRGALEQNGPFSKERLRIGLTGWGQRLLRAVQTLVYVPLNEIRCRATAGVWLVQVRGQLDQAVRRAGIDVDQITGCRIGS